MKQLKKTKIIVTLWPSSDNKKTIKKLYEAWANIIRMNYSHSNYSYFTKILDTVNDLNKNWTTNLSILTDTKWPEIRTKEISEKIKIKKDEIFILTTLANENNISKTDKKIIVCDYEYITTDLNVWNIVDIDTWLLKALIIEKKPWELICEALNKHTIWSKRHINLPWIEIHLPWITDNDKKDISFAVKQWTDFIALSFVRNKGNISELRWFLNEIHAPENIWIISKIENQEALDNLDEIIEYSDGVMIARWDLWAEVPYESLPIIQKMIAEKCRDAWKFFIVATQILESMTENPIPTRAEVTDIFNAVMQEADCTMLSWETAAWKYPIETVKTMKTILKYSESQVKYKHKHFWKNIWKDENKKLLIKNAIFTAENLKTKAIILFTNKWFTAQTAAAFRSRLPIFTFTYTDLILKKLNILFGLKSFVIKKHSRKENIKNAIKILKENKLVNFGDEIIIISWINDDPDTCSNIQVKTIK